MAGACPNRAALVFSNSRHTRSITFAELDARAARLADGLYAAGLREGHRAIVLAPVSLELYVCLVALMRLGAAAVFLDPQAGRQGLDRAAALAGAQAFIGSPKALWLRWISPSLRRVSLHFRVSGYGPGSLGRLARLAGSRTEIADLLPEAPALITLTGGSTRSAGPRAVLRSHRLLAAQHAALAHALPVQPGDVDLPAFPVAVLHNLASGITSVMPDYPFRRPEAVRPARVLRQIDQHGVTTASGSPAYWRPIAEYCRSQGRTLSLRRIVTGGAPISPRLIQELRRAAPLAEIICLYGSTEAEPVAVMPAQEFTAETARLTAEGAGIPLGHPVPDIALRVLNASGREQPAGEAGEIWVTGPHVALAGLGEPSAQAGARPQAPGVGWHPMGDVAYRDACGRLWLVGRVHTLITRAGRVLFPVCVEAAVEMLGFVRRAALVGLPDAHLGERAVLVVELDRQSGRPHDWLDQVRAVCARHDWPVDDIRTLSRLPLDARHNARIDYPRLGRGLLKIWPRR